MYVCHRVRYCPGEMLTTIAIKVLSTECAAPPPSIARWLGYKTEYYLPSYLGWMDDIRRSFLQRQQHEWLPLHKTRSLNWKYSECACHGRWQPPRNWHDMRTWHVTYKVYVIKRRFRPSSCQCSKRWPLPAGETRHAPSGVFQTLYIEVKGPQDKPLESSCKV